MDLSCRVIANGKTQVHTPKGPGNFTKYAGIIPLAGTANLETLGLEWNLETDALKFGEFISTSNHIYEDEIKFDVKPGSAPVILTLEMDL